MKRITVLYDETCSLCLRYRSWMQNEAAFVRVEHLGSDSIEARERFGRVPWLGTELVVVGDDNRVWAGADAFLVCLWALEDWREWSYRLSGHGTSATARRFFASLSSRRKWLARWLAHPTCTSGSGSAEDLRGAAPYRRSG